MCISDWSSDVCSSDLTDACAHDLADALGPDLRIAAPLGLGTPHGLLNALYRLTAGDPTRSMSLYTALSLPRPPPKPGQQRAFLLPFPIGLESCGERVVKTVWISVVSVSFKTKK